MRINTVFQTRPYSLICKEGTKDQRPRVFARTKQKAIKILGPKDLLKIIPVIKTKKQALAFVRLFTDGYTHKLFLKPAALEIFIANKENIHLLNDDNYGFGLINPKRAKEIGMLPTKIKQTKWGFIIQRNLIFYPKSTGHHLRLSRVTEHINTKKKTYYMQELRVISNEPWISRLLTNLESSKP